MPSAVFGASSPPRLPVEILGATSGARVSTSTSWKIAIGYTSRCVTAAARTSLPHTSKKVIDYLEKESLLSAEQQTLLGEHMVRNPDDRIEEALLALGIVDEAS